MRRLVMVSQMFEGELAKEGTYSGASTGSLGGEAGCYRIGAGDRTAGGGTKGGCTRGCGSGCTGELLMVS